MRIYPPSAVERAMKIQEVILRAMAKKITWWQAAEIIGLSDRSITGSQKEWCSPPHFRCGSGKPQFALSETTYIQSKPLLQGLHLIDVQLCVRSEYGAIKMAETKSLTNTLSDAQLGVEIEDAVEEGFHDCGGKWKYLIDEGAETADWTVITEGPEGPQARSHKIEFSGADKKPLLL